MDCYKVSFLAFVLATVVVVSGQEYFYDDVDSQPVRERRDVGDFILERNNEEISRNLRYRRDDENARHRRQGNHGNGGHEGITGPVHTFVKTDEHAHFKWGVRHHVGHEYAGRR